MTKKNKDHKPRIFIFDDNQEILQLCTEILEDLNCDVKTSPSTNEIESQVREYMPNLILMDNWLPDISGVEATQLLKSSVDLNQIPVIYFTANTDVETLAKEAGADDYLAKPFDINIFEDMVKKHLHL